jgi:hypothetical protein
MGGRDMKRLICATAVVLAIPLGGTAAADVNGFPNENASGQTGNGDPQGRKGECLVPGAFAIKLTTGEPGPNTIFGPPGRVYVVPCTPASG